MRVPLAAFAVGLLLPICTLSAQEAEVIEWETVVGPVSFPHRMHVEELGLDCSDCHHETNAARLDMPHPDYFEDFWIDCLSCHGSDEPATRPQACSACHHGSPVTIADETLSSKVVIHRSCWNCHEVTTGAAASEGCRNCHRRPQTGSGEGEKR